MSIRINKFLSTELSRRQADLAIENGQVKVNNQIAIKGQMISQDDTVTFNGKIIQHAKAQDKLWLYHKPPGYLVSHQRHNQMPTIFEIMPQVSERLIYCGRLDFLSEGLLLLTNSPTLAHDLTHNDYPRVYIVHSMDKLSSKAFQEIRQGINVNHWQYQPIKIESLPYGYQLTLLEGKNREIRNIFQHFQIRIQKLIRIQYHHFTLDQLEYNQLKLIS